MNRVFIGVDRRQPLGYTVLSTSIMRHAHAPVAITPLWLDSMPVKRRGLTDFTFSRFLVPYLCGYEGAAVFLDADILLRCDVAEIFAQADGVSGVQVRKSPWKFEWPAVMLFDCAKCMDLTPEIVEHGDPFAMAWADVGDLPAEYHHIVGYDDPSEDAKVIHYTAGVPEFREVLPCEHDRAWHQERAYALHSCSWLELMGRSVHAKPVLRKFLS